MYCLFWAKAGATLRSGRFPKAYTVCFHTNMVSSFHLIFFINMVDVFFNCMAYQKVNINYICFISLKLKYLMIGNTLLDIWNKSKYQLAIDCSTQYDQRSMSLPILVETLNTRTKREATQHRLFVTVTYGLSPVNVNTYNWGINVLFKKRHIGSLTSISFILCVRNKKFECFK